MKNYLWEIAVLPSADLSYSEAINRELNTQYFYLEGNISEIKRYCKQKFKDKHWFSKPIEEINVF